MAHAGALNNRLRFVGMLNLEGLTIANGELATGDWGEGFDDRRHPHTYLHEAMLMYEQPWSRALIRYESRFPRARGSPPSAPTIP